MTLQLRFWATGALSEKEWKTLFQSDNIIEEVLSLTAVWRAGTEPPWAFPAPLPIFRWG